MWTLLIIWGIASVLVSVFAGRFIHEGERGEGA
jgi:hypothetical protein